MEFLEVLENIQVENAYNPANWANEGLRVTARRKSSDPNYKRKLIEAARFVDAFYKGRIARQRFIETMSTSDFPLYFGDIIDRQALGTYKEWPVTWPSFVKRTTVPDFRTVKLYTMDGAESVLTQIVQELDAYPARKLVEGRYTYSVKKYGARMPFSWEAILNDDLDLLKDTPARFGRSARRTEERFAVDLFVDSTGPNSTFFSNTNKNVVNVANGASSNNPVLSITGLQDAMIVLDNQLDTDGEPIMIETVTLVVPTALRVTAMNILNAIQIITGADSAAQRIVSTNWMKSKVELVVNPYLHRLDTTTGTTAWYLFASPSTGRPAMVMGFLRGHEEPQLFMKSPNAVRVGGGTVNPLEGSFEDDSVDYKIRHVLGGTLIDPKMAVVSKGTGSA